MKGTSELALVPAANSGRTALASRGRPFPKGCSGNPRGRPKRDHDIAAMARNYGADAITALASVMLNPNAPPATRVMAANSLLDRGFGRAPQALNVKHRLSLAEEFEEFVGGIGGPARL